MSETLMIFKGGGCCLVFAHARYCSWWHKGWKHSRWWESGFESCWFRISSVWWRTKDKVSMIHAKYRIFFIHNLFSQYCGSETYSSPEVASGGRFLRVPQEIWSLGVGKMKLLFILIASFRFYCMWWWLGPIPLIILWKQRRATLDFQKINIYQRFEEIQMFYQSYQRHLKESFWLLGCYQPYQIDNSQRCLKEKFFKWHI